MVVLERLDQALLFHLIKRFLFNKSAELVKGLAIVIKTQNPAYVFPVHFVFYVMQNHNGFLYIIQAVAFFCKRRDIGWPGRSGIDKMTQFG